jgi:1,2-diacylglycerol 3-alpha-glucosyltransferase
MSELDLMNVPLLGIFNDSFPPVVDGVSMTTQNYAYWLSKKTKNGACVVTPKCPGSYGMPYTVYRYSSFGMPFRKPYRLGFPYMDWDFKRVMDEVPFGLVHAHCPFSSGKIAMEIAKKRHIPIVATFHSKYEMDFARCVPNRRMVHYLMQKIVDFYELADEVWIPQGAFEETLRSYGYKGAVEVVENGNDFVEEPRQYVSRAAAREELGMDVDEPIFLFVGQHIWEKNIGFLLQALERLKEWPFTMYFIGTGYAVHGIKKMTRELGLASHVVFVGEVDSRERLKQYYAAADLFLFPSVYDNAPLVVSEAAAMRTPSVMLRNSTAAAKITHGENGFLSEADVDDYAAVIFQLIHSPERMREAGRRASQTLARSWNSVMEEVIDRYVHLIARR